jgi:ElaB/YqjD/DUF883 family membrane-anchored ribosome-binding protein
MSEVTPEEIRSIRDDVSRLRAEIADRFLYSAERGWTGAKDTAQTVLNEIEERPLIATLLGLLVGLFIGLMLGSRR